VTVKTIGFTQVSALLTHQVDAVMGYVNNEPIQLERQGVSVRTLPVWQAQPLVSNGLVVLSSELGRHSILVRALVKATLQGVQYAIAHPQDAVRISQNYVPGLDQPGQAARALAVLQATIPLWQGASRLGYNDPGTWQSMASFLASVGMLQSQVDPTQAYTNSYLPG
jgi:NitT/TauT family transport system substrate-binding protein